MGTQQKKCWTIECNNQAKKNGQTNKQRICTCLSLLYSEFLCVVSACVWMHLQQCGAHIPDFFPSSNWPSKQMPFLSFGIHSKWIGVYKPKVTVRTIMYIIWNVCCELVVTLTLVSFHYFTFRSVAQIHCKGCLFNFCVTLRFSCHANCLFMLFLLCAHSCMVSAAVAADVVVVPQTTASKSGSMHALFYR